MAAPVVGRPARQSTPDPGAPVLKEHLLLFLPEAPLSLLLLLCRTLKRRETPHLVHLELEETLVVGGRVPENLLHFLLLLLRT